MTFDLSFTDEDSRKPPLEEAKRKVYRVSGCRARHPADFGHIVPIAAAKVPIVKVIHLPSKIACDISFRNKLSLRNSQFIAKLTEFDPRFRPLCIGLR